MMNFSKWQGLGNDFILMDPSRNRNLDIRGKARLLCDRHFGIGADGVVSIQRLKNNEFEMRIYNSDGSEAEMCGNVSRCVGLYIKKNKLAKGDDYLLHTRAGIIGLHVLNDHSVKVDMGMPRFPLGETSVEGCSIKDARSIIVQESGSAFVGTVISMGNPHFVIFVDNLKEVDLETWGPLIEKNSAFPDKTNVEFVQVLSPHLVRMRVWERGCGITMACGTGACATAVAGYFTGRTERLVTLLLDGGELQIEYGLDGHVYMTGPAQEIYQGAC